MHSAVDLTYPSFFFHYPSIHMSTNNVSFSIITKHSTSLTKSTPLQPADSLWNTELFDSIQPVYHLIPADCALPPLAFFFFFSFPSLPLFLASCRRLFEIWLLPSLPLRFVEDEVKGLRPFPLGLDRWGCSLGREEEEEEENSSGSSSRDWELPANSSDVVEGVLWKGRNKRRLGRWTAAVYICMWICMKGFLLNDEHDCF